MRSDAIRKTIRKVLDWVKLLLILATCVYLAQCLKQCGQSSPEPTERTVTVYDTIPYYYPVAVQSQQIGTKKVTIPTSYIDRGILSPQCSESARRLENLPDIRADTAELTSADVEATALDSLTLQLPITQNVYEGEDYKAYVSGVYPSLDSLFVYPRREIVTIKKPPKRWHIGPTVGFGYTPHGFEPFIGISLTYSIIDL